MSDTTKVITLTINGQTVAAQAGDTVLDAARRAGIHIPTLCAHEDLTPFGACRLCVVEIDNVRGYPTSCTTPAKEGMVVRTHTPVLEELRNSTLELMLSGHPHACLVCNDRHECDRPVTKAGRSTKCGACSNRDGCSIREMTLSASALPLNLPRLYSPRKVERDDPFIERNHNLCVLCGRCWRICEQLHGTPAISIVNRGREARIGTAFDRNGVESGCTFCGACVDICPTGTLTDRYARWYPTPRREMDSVCLLCPQTCSLQLDISGDQVVATKMTRFQASARLCVLGRFAYPQLLSSPARLLWPMVREDGELAPVPWDEAIAAVAAALEPYRDGGFTVIVGEPQTREDRRAYEQLAQRMHGRLLTVPSGAGVEAVPAEVRDELAAGKIPALWMAGDYVPEELLEKVKFLIVADWVPGTASRRADAVFPTAILAEVEGSIRIVGGELKRISAAVPVPGAVRTESSIVCELAKAMGVELEEGESSQPAGEDVPTAAPATIGEDPRERGARLPRHFRGHPLADLVPALQALGLSSMRAAAAGARTANARPKQLTGYRVVSKDEIVPNFHRLVLEAPTVARNAKPGQFAIVMVDPESERTPYTLVDWDKQQGTITLMVEEVGRSSQQIARLQAGDLVAHVTGPLGLPLPMDTQGTWVLGGGCFGVGAIYPIARALKQAGNRVICAIEGCTATMLYLERELLTVCDRLYLATKDGSRGRKGGVQDVFVELQRSGMKIDRYVAVGCTFMMRQVAKKTMDLGIPLQVALNPIMVDGTGMCGACRVMLGSETKFACVDGPFFDGHAVQWDQLASRRGAFLRSEVEAVAHAPEALKVLDVLAKSGLAGTR